jgi:hypothetical protein
MGIYVESKILERVFDGNSVAAPEDIRNVFAARRKKSPQESASRDDWATGRHKPGNEPCSLDVIGGSHVIQDTESVSIFTD